MNTFYTDNRAGYNHEVRYSGGLDVPPKPESFGDQLKITLNLCDGDLIVEIKYVNAETAIVNARCAETEQYPSMSETRECSVKAVQAALRIVSDWDSLGSEEDYRLAETVMSQHLQLRWIA